MSLRSVGNQLLQTTPNALLAGVSTASLSLWVRANPGCNVANSNGVEIFGDSGGKLSVTLSGSGSLQIQWSSHNGTTNSTSSCVLTLAPGANYHLASTWQNGTQEYFVNGVQVFADKQVGSIGVLGDIAPHLYRLGSDSIGTDVTLDEPTLWVGYALSPQDVLNLRDRAVQPQGIAPSSIALQWSLAGSDGAAAKVGDTGLADSSKSGLNLSSIVGAAPTYQAGVLSYYPPVKASIAPSGESIALLFEDGSGNPINVSAVMSANDVQTITLGGTPSGSSFKLTFNGQTTAAIPINITSPPEYILYTLPVTAGHPQQIAVTWPVANPYLASEVLYEFHDGTVSAGLLGTATISQHLAPSGFTDAGVVWQALGTFTPTGSTITVRVMASADGLWIIDALRIEDTNTSVITYVDDTDPAVAIVGPNTVTTASNGGAYGGSYKLTNGDGAGALYQIDPAAIQTALLAISSVQASGLTVTSPGNSHGGPFTVAFGGPMSNSPQPPITSSDPAFTVAHTNVGNVVPSISINGGSAIPLVNPLWGVGLPFGAGGSQSAPYLPYILYPLPQAAPAVTRYGCGERLFSAVGPWNAGAAGGSYSNRPFNSVGAGATAYFPFQGLPAGTYQFAATWPSAAGLCTTAQFLIQDQAGNTLQTVVVDQTVAPSDFTAAGFGWKTISSFTIPNYSTINGLTLAISNVGTSGEVVIDAVQMTRTSADYSVTIQPGDTVTLTIPAGVITTVAGAVGAVTNQAVTNLVGGSLLAPFSATAKTLQIGYNVEVDGATNAAFLYSNLARRIQSPADVLASDSNGYPTKITTPQFGPIASTATLGGRSSDYFGHGKGIDNLPSGYYTVLWDGPSNLSLVVGNTPATEVTGSVGAASYTGTKGNARVFNLQPDVLDYSPSVTLQFTGTDNHDGTSTVNFQNLRVYPPDPSDPTGLTPWGLASTPPKFHPNLWNMIGPVQCLRMMDQLNTNNSGIHDFSQLKQPTSLSYGFPDYNFSVPITSIQAPAGDPYFDTSQWFVIQVTTSAPHNLYDGLAVDLSGVGVANLSNSSTFDLDSHVYGGIHVTSPTTFLAAIGQGHGGLTMTNVLTPASGLVSTYYGSFMPLADMIELCNSANNGAGCDLWFNVPTVATDACVTAMAQSIASGLKPGRKVHVEYSNECWNSGFINYFYCSLQTFKATGGASSNYDYYYVRQAQHVHNLFLAAFKAAGRPSDVIRVMGSNAFASTTGSICDQAIAIGAQFEEVATAPYFSYPDYEPTLAPIFELMTVGQALDLCELYIRYGGFFGVFSTSHKTMLASKGFTTADIVHYEGGPQGMTPYGTSVNAFQISHAVVRHPRMYNIILAGFLQRLQDAGSTLINIFYLFQALNGGGGVPYEWSTYFGWNQKPGTGNPTTDAINVSDPEALDQVKSEVGGAYQAWAALAAPAASSSPTQPKKRLIPGRNGEIKATGFPRGAFRPTR